MAPDLSSTLYRRQALPVLFLLCLMSHPSASQDWVTPSSKKPSEVILRGQALLPDQSRKLEVIEVIRERWVRGEIAAGDPASLRVLRELVEEGVQERNRGGEAKNFPEARRQAVVMIGLLGGSEARNILQSVLLQDTEPMVLSEAIHSLRTNNLPLTYKGMEGLVRVFSRFVVPKLDANLAYAGLLLLRETPVTDHPLMAEELFKYLLRVLDLPFPAEVKQLAREVVQRWIQRE